MTIEMNENKIKIEATEVNNYNLNNKINKV